MKDNKVIITNIRDRDTGISMNNSSHRLYVCIYKYNNIINNLEDISIIPRESYHTSKTHNNDYAYGDGCGMVYRSNPFVRVYTHANILFLCNMHACYIYNMLLCEEIARELDLERAHV